MTGSERKTYTSNDEREKAAVLDEAEPNLRKELLTWYDNFRHQTAAVYKDKLNMQHPWAWNEWTDNMWDAITNLHL